MRPTNPLFDIATGIHDTGRARQMGADVRLTLPGRCLRCLGGLRDEAGARRVLASADAEREFFAGRDWRVERAGSLASLNSFAVGLAQRLLEDFIAGRLAESVWVHLEFDAEGHLSVSYPVPESPRLPCPLCRLSGLGEEGLPRVVTFFQQAA